MLKRTGALGLLHAFAVPLCAWSISAVPVNAAPFSQTQASPTSAPTTPQQAPPGRWIILLHGGAGAEDRSTVSSEREKAFRAGLDVALQAAARVLNSNGSAVSAVEAGLRVLEDDPLFQATRSHGLEASIMDGATMKSGSVVGIKTTKNPISLAKVALYKTPNGALIDGAADPFAIKMALPQVAPPTAPLAADAAALGSMGIVVRDRSGDLAAGTTTSQTVGRAGAGASDLPLLAEETYASNRSCAVASTGSGDVFLKLQVAHSICALVQYTGMDLQQAEDEVVQHQLTSLKGQGGVVAITADGQLGWSFNTPGMLRARLIEGGAEEIGIYKNEP